MSESRSALLAAIGDKPLTGQRVAGVYRLRCPSTEAKDLAALIAHEHSLELSDDVLPEGFLKREIVGRIEDLQVEAQGTSRCVISYPAELASGGLIALLNLLMGNAAFLNDVTLIDAQIPESICTALGGPRFGVSGLRRATRVFDGPMGATALKPLGASPRELATIASAMARGGVDILKEDDGISTQVFAPFHERVERCAAAVQDANAQTGGHTLYFPNVTGPLESLVERAWFAKETGAAGVEILPGMTSLDSIRMLASLPGFGLPVLAHCAWQGALCRPPNATIAMDVVFGMLPRLAGADLSITTSFGGRFNLSRADCAATAGAMTRPLAAMRPMVAMPGGGITPDRLDDVVSVFGMDCALLVSGALFRQTDLAGSVRQYMDAVRSLRTDRVSKLQGDES